MPASVIGAVVASVVTDFAATTFASMIFARVIGAVAGFVVSSLVRSAIGGDDGAAEPATRSDPSAGARSRTQTIRAPITPWQIIYGEARVGGAITYIYVSGSDLHMVITLAGHVCQEIGDIYLNDEVVPLDGSGNATGTYAGYFYCQKSLGDEGSPQQPFPGLVTATGGDWSENHLQAGRTKIWVKLTANRDLFPQGVPNITAVVKGRKVIDPRTSPTGRAYSANAALCAADYLMDSDCGFGATFVTEIDETQLIAAANVCDEQVLLAGSPTAYESRYEVNGAFSTDAEPKKVLSLLLDAMAGKAVNVGGKWYIFAGSYDAPTVTLDEDDFVGPVRVQSLVSRRENCNGVKGLFTDPNSFWQPTSFPAIASDQYRTEDGGERKWRDLDLSAFVTSGTQAQRLAKINLLYTRQGLTVTGTFRLAAWAAMTGRTVALTFAKFGWSSKAFEVAQTRFTVADSGELAVELTLRETAAAVFDWAASEEQAVDIAPNSTLPDPFANLTISGFTAESGTSALFRQADGTIVPRVRLRWTAPSNPFILYYEVQFERLSLSPTEWIDEPKVLAPKTETYIYGANDGEVINVRIRARTRLGNAGDFSYIYSHTVVGKTEAPSNVTGLVAVQTGEAIVFTVDEVTDADLDLIEIRYGPQGTTDWGSMVAVTNILRGTSVTSAAVPPGTWTFGAKARDTSGNYSATMVTYDLTVSATGKIELAAETYAPFHDGVTQLTNMVRHWTGVLTPDSQSLASALDWEVFDQFVPNAYTDCYATFPQIDTGGDGSARAWAEVTGELGPGETSGSGSATFQFDHRLAAGSYDGFDDWPVGIASFRYCKGRIHVDTTVHGKTVISQVSINVDTDALREDGTLTVDGTGTGAVAFTTAFRTTPVLQLTPQGSGDVSASYASLTSTGFTGYFKTGGAASAGTMSYTATGA